MVLFHGSEKAVDAIHREHAWRQKELSTIILSLKEMTPVDEPLVMKQSILMLYAHWEGFVKRCSKKYIQYINSQRCEVDVVNKRILSRWLVKRVIELGNAGKIDESQELIIEVLRRQCLANQFNDEIEAESNLTSKVLRRVFAQLDFDYREFELLEKYIDSKLVRNRNTVAHTGNCPDLDNADMLKLAEKVVELLGLFRDLIIDGITDRKYLSHT